MADLIPCEARGPDGTELAGCAKLYLPLTDGPPSEPPFAFVLQLARDADTELVWVFMAFGPATPARVFVASTSVLIANGMGGSPRRSSREHHAPGMVCVASSTELRRTVPPTRSCTAKRSGAKGSTQFDTEPSNESPYGGVH